MAHEFPTPLETVMIPDQSAERRLQAQQICQQGDYALILETFTQYTPLREESITQLKTKHRESLKEATNHLTEYDWEMLTILELFDTATFEHCLRTYEVARQKIESTGAIGEFLRAEIKKEGLTEWDIEHACLLHDMGKIALVPKDIVLNNTLNDSAWHELFESFCHQSATPEEATEKLASYEHTLRKNPRLREHDITPLRLALTEAENTMLTSLGIDTALPLGTVIAQHQDISVAIVERYFPDSPLLDLIGNHHEKALTRSESRPTSQSIVRMSALVSTLRMSDVFDALRSERPYKKSIPLLASLTLLMREADHGFIRYDVALLWIQDELAGFNVTDYLATLDRERAPEFEAERKSYHEIAAFLTPPLKRAA